MKQLHLISRTQHKFDNNQLVVMSQLMSNLISLLVVT